MYDCKCLVFGVQMKEVLLRKLEVLSPHLPPNTLDELIDGLGGPSRVRTIYTLYTVYIVYLYCGIH